MSLWGTLKSDDNLFREAVAASVLLHFAIFHAGEITKRLPVKKTIEIDITNMGRMSSTLAPPMRAPAPPAPKPAVQPKAWVAPKKNETVAPAPVPTKSAAPTPPEPPPPQPPAGSGEIGIGTGEGGEGQLARLPQLKNLSDLAAIQKRFYPEKAREDGREAVVVLDIHIDEEGSVTGAEIVQSGDPDFEQAAIRVVKLLRFTPAYVGSRPVAVKMRQAIQFKLER